MRSDDYLRILVEDIHSATVATIAPDGHPQTRVIDMMLHDRDGVYFLTAKGKAFYSQLTEQGFIALSATADKRSVSLRGRVRDIGHERLDEIFERNTYMKAIYPGSTRTALAVFCVYEAQGEYFDISDPSHVTRSSFTIGAGELVRTGYVAGGGCTGCGTCLDSCPQKCIDTGKHPAVIDQGRCLHCGRCAELCPVKAIGKKTLAAN